MSGNSRCVRGQTAVEYLMTYAWAVMLIVAGLGVLFWFSISPASSVTPSCMFSSEISCDAFAVNESGYLVVKLGQATGHPIRVDQVKCSDEMSATFDSSNTLASPVTIPNGAARQITDALQVCQKTVNGQMVNATGDTGDLFKGNIFINYTELDTNVSHVIKGQVVLRYEEIIIPGASDQNASAVQYSEVTAYGTTISSPGDYVLTSDLQGSGTALTINASNVNLDCLGNGLYGDGSQQAYGILMSGVDNVTITGCTINGFYTGLRVVSSNYDTITENTFTNCSYQTTPCGIGTPWCCDHPEWCSDGYGAYLENSVGEVVSGNTFTSNLVGISANGITYSRIDNNVLTSNTNLGVYLWTGYATDLYTNATNNHITNSSTGIQIGGVNYVYAHGNTIAIMNGYTGVGVWSAANTEISGNEIYSGLGNNSYGLSLGQGSTACTISENNIHDNEGVGIYVQQASGYTITDNTLSGNSFYGLRMWGGLNNVVSGNTITGTHVSTGIDPMTGIANPHIGTGIYLDAGSDSNIVQDNIVTGNEGHGFATYDMGWGKADNTILSGNRFCSNLDSTYDASCSSAQIGGSNTCDNARIDANCYIVCDSDCSGVAPPPRYSSNQRNTSRPEASTLFSLAWTSSIGLSGYVFSFDNGTGTFVNDSWVAMTGTSNWSNVTKTVSTEGSVIRWCVYANDSANTFNDSCGTPFSYTTTTSNVITGGAMTNFTNATGTYIVHTFTSNGTFSVADAQNVMVLVVGGGGGGGYVDSTVAGGGGGGGGVVYFDSYSASGDITVTVGEGGASSSNGENSVFGTLTAIGGGAGGGGTQPTGASGSAGGSGGGGGSGQGSGGSGGSGTQGYSGGAAGAYNYPSYCGGGGGGAGQTGFAASTDGGVGGSGLAFTIYDGTAITYAGGGGGATFKEAAGSPTPSLGGAGGGGNGTYRTTGGTVSATAGITHTGGGGGGGSYYSGSVLGGAGGSGIVIVSYRQS